MTLAGLPCSWVEEYHVDGFRFDLASCLCRDPQGRPLAAPPLIRELAKDPVLSKVRASSSAAAPPPAHVGSGEAAQRILVCCA